jgi:hypothetical protein
MSNQTTETSQTTDILFPDTTNTILKTQEDSIATSVAVIEGFEGIPRHKNNSYNNSLLIFLIFSLFVIFIAISRRKISFRTIVSSKEESKEEVRHTIIDLITTLSLCTITIVLSAISIIYLTSETTAQPILTLEEISKISGVIFLFLLAQHTTIGIIGNIFSTPNETKKILKENTTYYTLPAIILTPIICSCTLATFSPNALIYTALTIIALVRLIFILRNIKIFKHNISTTCYIILYLCTVEIMPIAILYKWAVND